MYEKNKNILIAPTTWFQETFPFLHFSRMFPEQSLIYFHLLVLGKSFDSKKYSEKPLYTSLLILSAVYTLRPLYIVYICKHKVKNYGWERKEFAIKLSEVGEGPLYTEHNLVKDQYGIYLENFSYISLIDWMM